MLELIFKPLNYLDIKWEVKGKITKRSFDYILPAICSIVVSIVLVIIDSVVVTPTSTTFSTNIFDGDFTGLLSGFLQTIPGFYIAALAAIATLNSDTMDNPMLGQNPPYEVLVETNPARVVHNPVSRRRFLSSLFAYLSFVSLLLFFLTLIFKYFYNLNIIPVNQYLYLTLYFINLFIFFFFFAQLVLLTLIGLYYLGDRVHRN
ncbi:hypothetical protein [Acinetobacter lactucae]|uniref:Uncharacterized protein n=1 Tax=Acinetobacter lactucae TaxID=1785128 RepID=R8YTN7_9GAMM|nr:hypothetical protein [Acinetobacter lactucae]EOQ72790.1 hypothetical protein F929_02725 [Acinetobacter lactucae]